MKKNFITYSIIIFLLISCIVFVGYKIWGDPFALERRNLAKELGVETTKYQGRGFPINYFTDVLKPGMSSDEVHQKVKGYKIAYLCDNNKEFYYFFSTDGNKADRILIFYNEKGNLKYTLVEGINEHYLQNYVNNCVSGRR
jgi:hypothetical protein